MFKIIGAAADTPNLLCEFNIAEKKEDKLTNNKKGKVILVKLIVRFSLSEFSLKPGAIIKTNPGIKISIIKIMISKKINSKLNTVLANFFACFFPKLNSEE